MIKSSQAFIKILLYTTTFFFVNHLCAQLENGTFHNTHHLYSIFSSPESRKEFSPFFINILKQVSPEKFYALVDEILSDGQKKNDKELYEALIQKISTIKPFFPLYAQIKSLNNQKKVLGNQALLLLRDQKKIDGCVEIGTPGTYATTLGKNLSFTGKLYAVNDQKKLTDAFQAFSFKPTNNFAAYDSFISLANYEPLSEKDIANNSVDLVICFIGLHHIPLEKIDAFIASIHRVLRPGGVFLLRDHNCSNQKMESLIFAAHAVYNAIITNEPLENELNELRNFQKLDHWIERLEKHGFKTGTERLLQHGDPTLNTMVKFTKIALTEQEQLIEISHALSTQDNYIIDSMQTHLTSAEWFNVDSSQEYGKFIEHTPFYNFPYLNNIGIYWKIFKNSWNIAQAKRGTVALLSSSYTLMSLFIGIFMTVEYSAKALISWPIRKLYNEDPLPIKVLIHDSKNQIETLDTRITILKHYQNTPFALIEMPRNKDFLQIIEKIEHTDIVLQEIAGQKEIQIKALLPDTHQAAFIIDGCKQEYSWNVPTKPNYTFLALTIEIKKLKTVFKKLRNYGIQILHIHDF